MFLTKLLKKNASFLLLITGLLVVRASLADQYTVPTGSMEPTIHVGDRIFVNKLAYDFKFPLIENAILRLSEPQRGEIVVFRSPEAEGLTLVKRLIGLPGDHVQIENGFVRINGELFEGSVAAESRIVESADEFFYEEKTGEHLHQVHRIPNWARGESLDFTVPEDQYFFMGDNRDNSLDSRAWGFAPRKNLKGKAVAVFYNLSLPNWIPHMEVDRIGKALN